MAVATACGLQPAFCRPWLLILPLLKRTHYPPAWPFDNFHGLSVFLYGFASCLLLPCYRSLVVGARPGVGPEVLNGFKAVRSMG